MNILLEKYEVGATVEFGIYGKGGVLKKRVMSRYIDPSTFELFHYEKGEKRVIDYVLGKYETHSVLTDPPKASQKDLREAVNLGVKKYGALHIEKCPRCNQPAKFFLPYGYMVMLGCKDCNYSYGSSRYDYKEIVDGWNKLSIENRQ